MEERKRLIVEMIESNNQRIRVIVDRNAADEKLPMAESEEIKRLDELNKMLIRSLKQE